MTVPSIQSVAVHLSLTKKPNHQDTTTMAATTAAITSPFTNLKTTSKAWPMFLRLASSSSSSSTIPVIQMSSSSLSHHMRIDPIPSPISGKWPMMKISASVAHRETAVSVTSNDEEQVISSGDQPEETNSSVHTKLYFGNLPYLCDSAQLAGIIQDYGSPELVEVLYDRDTGKSRGFAFVTMSSIEDCKAVIENLDGREYGGRTLRVNFSDKPKPKEPLYPETEYKLFVGNLSWSVTAESLTEMFSEHGNVVGARVLYDGETGRSRGYGFVSYSTKSEMETALQILNGAELEGRSLRVSLAQGKKQ